MWNLIYVELYKTFAKPRTYIGIIAVILIMGMIQVGNYIEKDNNGGILNSMMGESVTIENLNINGNAVFYYILWGLVINLNIIVSIVSGDSVSGEMASGTIRALMTKPLARWKLFFAKFFANQVYILILVLTLLVFGLYLSRLIFGIGDMVVYGEEISIISHADTLWRFLFSLVLIYIYLTVVSSLAFMLSCLLENSIAPIVLTMIIIIALSIFSGLPVDIFKPIQEYLFTNQSNLYKYSFYLVPDTSALIRSLEILGVYFVVFMSVAYFSFTRKDITQ